MPVRLVVGRQSVEEQEAAAVVAVPQLEMSRVSLEPFWVQEIPGLYGLRPFARLAAGLEMHGTLPASLPPGTIEWDLLFEAYDSDLVRFPTVISSPAGAFVPPGYSGRSDEETGSLQDLRDETENVLQHMSGPPTLALALQDIGVEPYGLEWFGGKALLQACEIGLEMRLPLRYVWRYPLKDPKEPFTYYSAPFWGLNQVAEVRIVEEGAEIRVHLVGGYVYRLPVEFAQTWSDDLTPTPGALAMECRFEPRGRHFEVKLDNDQVLHLSMASFLVWCEPMYDDLAEWTPDAEAKVRRGYEEYGPFRLEPV